MFGFRSKRKTRVEIRTQFIEVPVDKKDYVKRDLAMDAFKARYADIMLVLDEAYASGRPRTEYEKNLSGSLDGILDAAEIISRTNRIVLVFEFDKYAYERNQARRKAAV
jgi:ribulose 1,5-bisphosphate carboxylase large subunit-like protein